MIPGWLISILTFPGVIIHEWAHKKFCEWLGVPVYEVVYFRFGNPAGYVIHGETANYKQTFWVSVGPLVINSLFAVVFSLFASGAQTESVLWFVLMWIAISAGMNSFPSNQDMKHIFEASKKKLKGGGSPLHYLSFPFVGLIFLANLLSFIWFDLWYALGLITLGNSLASYIPPFFIPL